MLLRLAILTLFSIIYASASDARPLLDHASPSAGSTISRPPSHVALSFTEALLPSGSDAVVRNATGGIVSSGKARLIGNKAQLQVPVNSLSPGKYRVEWYATSSDRRPSQGSFSFVVGGSHGSRSDITGSTSRLDRRHASASVQNHAHARRHHRE
jgi:methionine-rich copper-binding protein CopC